MPAMARLPAGTLVDVLCGQPEQKCGRLCRGVRLFLRALLAFEIGNSFAKPFAERRVHAHFFQSARNGERDDGRGQLIMGGQQPVTCRLARGDGPLPIVIELANYSGRALAFAPGIQLFLDLVFDQLALFLDDKNFFQPVGKGARSLRL